MILLQRTTPADPAFQALVTELDQDLQGRYGDKQNHYDAFNKSLGGASVVLAVDGDKPVGCGCFKAADGTRTVEVKRMYVQPSSRRSGIARQLLTELERWATEKGYSQVVLQTAVKQPEAIALYQRCGYRQTDKYGVYVGDEDSVCLKKHLVNVA